MRLNVWTILCLLLLTQLPIIHPAYAEAPESDLRSSPIIQNYFLRFLPQRSANNPGREQGSRIPRSESNSHNAKSQNERQKPEAPVLSLFTRRRLADEDTDSFSEDESTAVKGMSVTEMRAKISEHRLKLARLEQESKDLAHERSFLEKTLELKKGQRNMQDGQVKLSRAELEDKAKEIEMYRREAPRTLLRYNELVRKQKEMQDTLNRLHTESEELSTSRHIMMEKIHNLNMEDLVERHARGLPDAMAGALRKSAAALVPFFDYLMIAADTNNRLVDHVGAEIDKYTHVNISGSPFMSGILFYCVLLIPLLTFISFMRRLFDTSSKLTVSHYIILGNLYFVIMCVVNVIAAIFLKEDPMGFMWSRFERSFVLGNLFLSVYYAWHVAMLGLQALYTLEKRNISQFLATLSVGIHYFLFAWRRVFTDHAPTMYTFNYLMYATIFCFILYERYNRMSSRQLNDSTLFRLFHLLLKRRSNLTTYRGFKAVATEIWASATDGSRSSRRRFSKRHDRYTKSDHVRAKAEGHDKYKDKSKSSSISDEEEAVGQLEKKENLSFGHNKRNRNRPHQSRRSTESRGFISIFFGSRENGEESSEEGEEVSPPRTGWRFLGGMAGSRAVRGARDEAGTDIGRAPRATRSHRHRSVRDTRVVRTSIWRWS